MIAQVIASVRPCGGHRRGGRDRAAALAKVQAAEDAWNTRDPQCVAGAYTADSVWRNRDAFVVGREEIVAFLTAKWERELDYALRKNLWAFTGTASRSGSSTSPTTRRASGGAATATSCGSSRGTA
jgi:hypothetical protein